MSEAIATDRRDRVAGNQKDGKQGQHRARRNVADVSGLNRAGRRRVGDVELVLRVRSQRIFCGELVRHLACKLRV